MRFEWPEENNFVEFDDLIDDWGIFIMILCMCPIKTFGLRIKFRKEYQCNIISLRALTDNSNRQSRFIFLYIFNWIEKDRR